MVFWFFIMVKSPNLLRSNEKGFDSVVCKKMNVRGREIWGGRGKMGSVTPYMPAHEEQNCR